MPRSWKPIIETQGRGGTERTPNGLRFTTEDGARAQARDTYDRWMLAIGYDAEPSDDEPNAVWDEEQGGYRKLDVEGTPSDDVRIPPTRVTL